MLGRAATRLAFPGVIQHERASRGRWSAVWPGRQHAAQQLDAPAHVARPGWCALRQPLSSGCPSHWPPGRATQPSTWPSGSRCSTEAGARPQRSSRCPGLRGSLVCWSITTGEPVGVVIDLHGRPGGAVPSGAGEDAGSRPQQQQSGPFGTRFGPVERGCSPPEPRFPAVVVAAGIGFAERRSRCPATGSWQSARLRAGRRRGSRWSGTVPAWPAGRPAAGQGRRAAGR